MNVLVSKINAGMRMWSDSLRDWDLSAEPLATLVSVLYQLKFIPVIGFSPLLSFTEKGRGVVPIANDRLSPAPLPSEA